jgi:hypothetical protein
VESLSLVDHGGSEKWVNSSQNSTPQPQAGGANGALRAKEDRSFVASASAGAIRIDPETAAIKRGK